MTVTSPEHLLADGNGTLTPTKASGAPHPATGKIHQGALEASNVNMASEMAQMVSTQRAYQMNSTAIQTESQMMSIANQLRPPGHEHSEAASGIHRTADRQPGDRARVGAQGLGGHAEGLPERAVLRRDARRTALAVAREHERPRRRIRRRIGLRRRRLLEQRRGQLAALLDAAAGAHHQRHGRRRARPGGADDARSRRRAVAPHRRRPTGGSGA